MDLLDPTPQKLFTEPSKRKTSLLVTQFYFVYTVDYSH